MATIVIQHKVADFNGWKKAFESDPLGRAKNGVSGHAIYRGADEPDFVVIHLDFASLEQAQKFLPMLRAMWQKVGDKIGFSVDGVQARILDEVEHVVY